MANGISTIYRPGVTVQSLAARPPQGGVPTDTSVGFIVGEAAQGPDDEATQVTSPTQFTTMFGGRLSAAPWLYDGVEAFFREGGATLYVSRLISSTAVKASIAVTDLDTGVTLTANYRGTYANGYRLVIDGPPAGNGNGDTEEDGGDDGGDDDEPLPGLTFAAKAPGDPYTAQLLDGGGNLLQQSLLIYTQGDLANWLASGSYATLTGFDPAGDLAPTTVTAAGGTDGAVPVVLQADFDAALADFGPDLGPGQVWAPGRTTPAWQASLLVHASLNDRVALLDAPQGADVPTLVATAGALRGSDQDRYGSLWAPWATVPGIAQGTTRTIPWSSIQAGMIARLDAQTGNANRAAAGDFGQSTFALNVTQTFSDADRQTLLYAGCNTVRYRYGTVRAYAYRSLSDPNGNNGQWVQFNHSRLNMQIVADSEEIGEEYVFSQLDGRGLTIAAFHGELNAMLKALFDDGALYGDTPDDAFDVNTSPSVNTIETIANGELHAVLAVKMSPHAELVYIEIVKVVLTEALS